MLNEAANILETLACIQNASDVEVIAVDGESGDGTAELAKSWGAKVIFSPPGRARQMNAGAAAAKGEVFLFLHADTHLPEGFDGHIRRIMDQPNIAAGAFRLRLDGEFPGKRFIERAINFRAKYLHMPYGDQAIFLRAKMFFNINGFPDIPMMEDFELIRRLLRRGRVILAPASVITSNRRWKNLGTWQTTLINQAAIVAYCLGISPTRIARWYNQE
jgi:rSAM/selenodomain-associated transferase 2